MNPKFRAWLKEEKRMTDVNEMTFIDGEVYLISDVTDFYAYEEFKLMQSTGLKDKNGNEIFEGDIVKYKLEEKTFTDIASFNKFFACFGLEDDTGDWFCSFDWLLENIKQDDIEVVGNVYENQGLLKG